MNQEEEDVEDSKPEEKKEKEESPEPEHKTKSKKSFAAKFKRRPKSTIEGEKKPDEEVNTQRHSYHAGDKADEDQETKEGEKEKEQEKGEAEDAAPSELTAEPKSKIRRSFNMKFKRGSKKDEKDKEKEAAQETDAPKVEEPADETKEQAAMEESLQSDPPKSRYGGKFKRSKDAKNEPKDEENELETVDENAESGTPAESKPKLRKLNLRKGKQRPVSMSAADRPGANEEDDKFDRDDQVRHSYHAGDLPPPPPLRKYHCCYGNYLFSCLADFLWKFHCFAPFGIPG